MIGNSFALHEDSSHCVHEESTDVLKPGSFGMSVPETND